MILNLKKSFVILTSLLGLKNKSLEFRESSSQFLLPTLEKFEQFCTKKKDVTISHDYERKKLVETWNTVLENNI